MQLNTALKFYRDIHADLIYSLAGYDVISFFRSTFIEVIKTSENAASGDFGSNFTDAAFCMHHQLVSFLSTIHCWWVKAPDSYDSC